MTINEAAALLQERLRGLPWMTAVGVGVHQGAEAVFLYVTSLRRPELSFLADGWEGFPVVVKKMSSPRPLAIFAPNQASV